PPGKAFDVVIGEALQAAHCVVVLWSRASVESNWVKEEAGDAAERSILVPVLIEDVSPPLGFRRFQAARLVGWPDAHDVHELEQFLESVERLLGEHPARSAPSSAPSAVVSQRSSRAPRGFAPPRGKALVSLVLFLVIGLVVGINSALTNSDVGFIAAVPVWMVGALFTYWIWQRNA
ncbi:MAG: toll/interleukin-1 receptor domain-containing protein, partial [Vicinamibacterales bacterium]